MGRDASFKHYGNSEGRPTAFEACRRPSEATHHLVTLSLLSGLGDSLQDLNTTTESGFFLRLDKYWPSDKPRGSVSGFFEHETVSL